MFRLLLAVAVLWCGLHLSSAEADGGGWTGADAAAHIRSADPGADDHPPADGVHGCHNHCPVSSGIGHGPAIGDPGNGPALLFALPIRPLTPAAQAPPIEPPAA